MPRDVVCVGDGQLVPFSKTVSWCVCVDSRQKRPRKPVTVVQTATAERKREVAVPILAVLPKDEDAPSLLLAYGSDLQPRFETVVGPVFLMYGSPFTCVIKYSLICVFIRGHTYTKKLHFLCKKKKSRLRRSENAVRLLYAKNSDLTHQNAFSLFVFLTQQRKFVEHLPWV